EQKPVTVAADFLLIVFFVQPIQVFRAHPQLPGNVFDPDSVSFPCDTRSKKFAAALDQQLGIRCTYVFVKYLLPGQLDKLTDIVYDKGFIAEVFLSEVIAKMLYTGSSACSYPKIPAAACLLRTVSIRTDYGMQKRKMPLIAFPENPP